MSGKVGIKPYESEPSTDKIHLSDAAEKLLDVLKIPELRVQNVTKICEHAGISRDSYYRIWKNPDFILKYKELCQDTLLSFAMPASLALGKQAELGDVSAIKAILEMAGIYQPTAKVETTIKHDVGPNLLEMYRARQKQIEE